MLLNVTFLFSQVTGKLDRHDIPIEIEVRRLDNFRLTP